MAPGATYGTLRPAVIHVGMLQDCSKLGLRVREIRIAAGTATGAEVMACCAVTLSYHSIPVYVYIT